LGFVFEFLSAVVTSVKIARACPAQDTAATHRPPPKKVDQCIIEKALEKSRTKKNRAKTAIAAHSASD
jgi:hypothetical protein